MAADVRNPYSIVVRAIALLTAGVIGLSPLRPVDAADLCSGSRRFMPQEAAAAETLALPATVAFRVPALRRIGVALCLGAAILLRHVSRESSSFPAPTLHLGGVGILVPNDSLSIGIIVFAFIALAEIAIPFAWDAVIERALTVADQHSNGLWARWMRRAHPDLFVRDAFREFPILNAADASAWLGRSLIADPDLAQVVSVGVRSPWHRDGLRDGSPFEAAALMHGARLKVIDPDTTFLDEWDDWKRIRRLGGPRILTEGCRVEDSIFPDGPANAFVLLSVFSMIGMKRDEMRGMTNALMSRIAVNGGIFVIGWYASMRGEWVRTSRAIAVLRETLDQRGYALIPAGRGNDALDPVRPVHGDHDWLSYRVAPKVPTERISGDPLSTSPFLLQVSA